MGRPSKYTPELGSTICERIAKGELLTSICDEPDMPAYYTVLDWSGSDVNRQIPAFAQMYARAKRDRLERMAEELIRIADTPQVGEKTKTGKDGTEVTTGDMIEHRRLQVDTRKWLLARLAAHTYGDRVTQEVTGANGTPLIPSKVVIEVVPTPKAE